MRRQLVTLALAGLAIATTASGSSSAANDESSAAAPTVAVHRSVGIPAIRDEAAMVLVGTVLIGLGAVLRRAA